MRVLHLPYLPRATLGWLLWLAVLVPVAQLTAVWHGYSHVAQQSRSGGEDRQAPHAFHCDLCLAAADLSGNGPPSGGPSVQAATRRDMPSATGASSVWTAPPTLAYLSRAPPLTLR